MVSHKKIEYIIQPVCTTCLFHFMLSSLIHQNKKILNFVSAKHSGTALHAYS